MDETKGAPVLYQGRRSTTGSGAPTPSPSPISGLATCQSPGLRVPDYITDPDEGKPTPVMVLLTHPAPIPSRYRREPVWPAVNYAAP